MKSLYIFLIATLIANVSFAKTYTVGSGKWTDASIWTNGYPGTTINADDEVIINGQVTMNTSIVVEGKLQVEKGSAMVGMKDLVIAKSGSFVNNGNTVMKRIMNEGNIQNNLIMETMMDFDNKGTIDNNNNVVSGNNFDNFGGKVAGNNGAYFVNNTVHTSPSTVISKEVKVFAGEAIEASSETASR